MPRYTSQERFGLDAIVGDHDAMVAQLLGWSSQNSGSANLEGLDAMANLLSGALADAGAAASRIAADPVEAVDASGVLASIRRGDHLHAWMRPGAKKQILLVGHMDTVFAADHPFQRPGWRDRKTLNGPGVADMKGGLLVMIAALKALNASPWAGQLGVQIVINSDEEVSSLGSARLLRDCAASVGAALVFEPAMADGTLAGARKGLGSFSAVAMGRAAHAGRNPKEGRNAILAIADLFVRLARLKDIHPGLSINVARIEGGGPVNVVPDRAVGRFELRVADHAAQHAAEAALAALIAETSAAHDLEIRLHGSFHRPPKPMDETQLALFEAVLACADDLDLPLGWTPTGGCCDGNNLAAAGLPVVDTLGVRGGAIHSSDEYMLVESLVERAQLVALLLMRLASGALTMPARSGKSIA